MKQSDGAERSGGSLPFFFRPIHQPVFSPRFSPASRRNIDSFIFKLLLFVWLFVCNIGWLNSKETPQKTVARTYDQQQPQKHGFSVPASSQTRPFAPLFLSFITFQLSGSVAFGVHVPSAPSCTCFGGSNAITREAFKGVPPWHASWVPLHHA